MRGIAQVSKATVKNQANAIMNTSWKCLSSKVSLILTGIAKKKKNTHKKLNGCSCRLVISGFFLLLLLLFCPPITFYMCKSLLMNFLVPVCLSSSDVSSQCC